MLGLGGPNTRKESDPKITPENQSKGDLDRSICPELPKESKSIDATHRQYYCARCGCRTLICRRCDRGHIYCSPLCSSIRRKESLRRASRRYQKTKRGARRHAVRQKTYRYRKSKVTHQGSSSAGKSPQYGQVTKTQPALRALSKAFKPVIEMVCRFCGCPSSRFVRQGFITTKRSTVLQL